MEQKNIFQKPSQSSILFYSFLLCMCLVGLAMLGTEIFFWVNHDAFLFHLKVYGNIVGLGITLAAVNIHLFVCVLVWTPCIIVKDNDCVSFALQCLTWFIFLCCCFALEWATMSSFAVLLLTLAYPLHVTSLVMLHISFLFVFSITFAIFVLDVLLIWKDRKKNSLCKTAGRSITTIFFILNTLVFVTFSYRTIIWGYASTVVQRLVPAERAVQGLYLLPSLILFVVGWMLKRNFFGMLT